MRRLMLQMAAALATAFSVYAAFVVVTVVATAASGEGIACRDAGCGVVSNWLDDAAPWPMVSAIVVAAAAGFAMAAFVRRR